MSDLDRRLNAYRADLADARLEGRVDARRFTGGEPAEIAAAVASLHPAFELPDSRFADFVPRPGELWDYLKRVLRRREPPYLGHNPAAAVMILFLLVAVTAIGISGWWLTTDAGWGSGPGEALHEWLAELTLAAVAVHVTAAIYESIHLRENLVRAMIDGTKRAR